MITPDQHRTEAYIIARIRLRRAGDDALIMQLRGIMHMAAATGDYVGEAAEGVPAYRLEGAR